MQEFVTIALSLLLAARMTQAYVASALSRRMVSGHPCSAVPFP